MTHDLKHTALPIAAAVFSAFTMMSSTTHAADLTVAGMIDTGLRFYHVNDGVNGSTNRYEMADGLLDGNRLLFIGHEDLSPETDLGFWLEASFTSDSGEMKTSGTLFDRGVYMWIRNKAWGQLSAGRSGAVRSGATPLTFDITWNRINPFGTGWGELGNPVFLMPFYGFSVNNMLQYDTPTFGPLQAHVQHSFAISNETGVVEGKSSADRYTSLSLTFDSEVVNLVAMLDTINENSNTGPQKDMVSALVGGNVNWGDVRFYAWGSWFKNADNVIALPGFSDYSLFQGMDRINGYSFGTGVRVPFAGGNINAYAMTLKADYDDTVTEAVAEQVGSEVRRYGAAVGYTYPLSQRTTLYGAVGFYKDVASLVNDGHAYHNPMSSQVMFGINHKF